MKLGGAGLAGAALLGASGCGTGGGSSSELVYAHWQDPGWIQQLLKRFNKQDKGRVTYLEMPFNREEYLAKLETEFQVRGGRIDVAVVDVIWTAELAANDWIADVSGRFSGRSNFFEGSIQSLTYRGGIYGVPWGTDAGILYYREDLLEQSGYSEAPKTWEDLKEMAGKVVRDSGTKFGFVFQGGNYEGGVCNGLEFIWTHGGEVVDPDDPNKVIINSPESVAGLATERSMVSDGIAPQAVANYTEQESSDTFLTGDAVFCRNWPYMYAIPYGADPYPNPSNVKPEQVGVSSLPVGGGQLRSANCLGGENLVINASSEMQDEAWEFVRFATDEEGQRLRIPLTTPTLKTLYEDRQVLKEMPVISLVKEALQHSRPRPVSPHYSEMSLRMAEQFNGVLKGVTSPEEAVETLQSELQQIIERGG
ncbi:MAG: ABC transporter substrate-binding protein [Rubrobacter sp.]